MRIVILGGGLTGLSAAWKLTQVGSAHSITVIEKLFDVGGLAGSFRHGPYLLDYGPHRFYTTLPNIFDDITELIGDDLHRIPKKLGFHLQGKLLDFPVRFTDLLTKMGVGFTWKAGTECLHAIVRGRFTREPDTCYRDLLVHQFGPTISSLFFEPLARKAWGEPTELDARLARSRVLPPDPVEMIKETLGLGSPMKPIEHFYYTRESISEIGRAMKERIEQADGAVLCGAVPTSISIGDGMVETITVQTADGRRDLPVDFLISTIPLGALLHLFEPRPADRVLETVDSLEYADLLLAYFTVKRRHVLDYAWVYYPEEDVPFTRLMDKRRFSETGLPEDRTVLCAECTRPLGSHSRRMDDDRLYEEMLPALEVRGVVSRPEIEDYFTVTIPHAYPLYPCGFRKPLDATLDYCHTVGNLLTVGRHGMFNYSNMDHAMDMGAIAADYVQHGGQGRWTWERILKRIEEYRIYG